MTDNWDDSDDEWDADDAEIDKKLGLVKNDDVPAFDDEEDLALKEKEAEEKAQLAENKKKGAALAARKEKEAAKAEELEVARRTVSAFRKPIFGHLGINGLRNVLYWNLMFCCLGAWST